MPIWAMSLIRSTWTKAGIPTRSTDEPCRAGDVGVVDAQQQIAPTRLTKLKVNWTSQNAAVTGGENAMVRGSIIKRERRAKTARALSHDEHLGTLANVVREARRGRLTLTEVAQRAGVSPSVISDIEHGRANPSLGTLLKVAEALDLRVSDFFQLPDSASPSFPVVRRGEHPQLTSHAAGVVYELLTPRRLSELAVVRSRVPPGFNNEDQPSAHPGWECALMVAGRMEHHQNGEVYLLEAGDSITYDASTAHWISNPGPDWLEVIDIQSPSSLI